MDSGGSSSSGSRLSRIGQEATRHRRGDESQGDESRNDGISEVLTVVTAGFRSTSSEECNPNCKHQSGF